MSDCNEETLRKDLKFQLSFENMDWDYFIETAQRAKDAQEREREE